MILEDAVPRPFCPSMNAETISKYIKFKRGLKEETLQYHGENVLDISGEIIKCSQSWIAPKNVKQLNSSGSALHQENNQGGTYIDICNECFLKDSERNIGINQSVLGCRRHPYNPKIFREGDPFKSKIVSFSTKSSTKAAKDSGYKETGDSPLTPNEYLLIRNHLLSTNSIINLQVKQFFLILSYMY